MSVEDAEHYIESKVRTERPLLKLNDVVIFVDFHEDNTKKSKSLIEALASVEIARKQGTMVRAHLHAGDVVIARIVRKEYGDDDDEGERVARDTFDRNTTVDSVQASVLLEDGGAATKIVVLYVYERKTIGDLASSVRSTKSVVSENHIESELGRLLALCQATGGQPRLLIEGYMSHALTAKPVGAMSEDGIHSFLCRVAREDGILVWQSANTEDSARLLWKDARYCGEHTLLPCGWVRIGTGENRANARLEVRKADNYTPEKWYRGALQSILQMSKPRADAIVQRYTTMPSLVRAFARCPSDRARVKLVGDIKVNKRRLGDVLARRIVDRFYSPGEGSAPPTPDRSPRGAGSAATRGGTPDGPRPPARRAAAAVSVASQNQVELSSGEEDSDFSSATESDDDDALLLYESSDVDHDAIMNAASDTSLWGGETSPTASRKTAAKRKTTGASGARKKNKKKE